MNPRATSASHPGSAQRKVRLRLWEVHHGNHCAILGTCLPLKATRRILRKAKVPGIERATDYAVHCTAVDMAQHRGAAARLLDKALERTHATTWAVYGRLKTRDDLVAQWRRDVRAGNITGPFWAVMHHPAADRDLLMESFGVVHMLSHQVGGSCRDRLRRFDKVHDELEDASRKREALEKTHATEMQALRGEIAERDKALVELKKETLTWRRRAEAGDPERVAALEDERDHRIRALARSERLLRHAQETIRQLQYDLQVAEEKVARASMVSAVAKDATDRPPGLEEDFEARDDPGAHNDLAGCTLLYVGGEKSLLPHLRRMTKAANGRLLHHDGGIEDSLRTLPRLCSRADVVLCPMSKVGHMAVGHVKRTCMETCKPFIPLRRASLEAFCSGLSRVAASLDQESTDAGLIH